MIKVGCGAVIINDKNQVLLMKRGPKARNRVGSWTIPGGGIEQFERITDGIKREIKEELGIDIEVTDFLCIVDDIVKETDTHWISVVHKAHISFGTPINREPGKCDEIRWFDLNDIPQNIMKPSIEGINILKKSH